MIFAGSPLESLSPEEKSLVRANSRLVMLKRQGTLDPTLTTQTVLVVSGIVRIEAVQEGGLKGCAGFIKKGEMCYLGEGVAYQGPERFELKAVLDCDLYLMDPQILLRVVSNNPTLAALMLSYNLGRIRQLYAKIGQSTSTGVTPEQVVGQTLRVLSTPADNGKPVVDKRISQREIAESLGLTREQVNRVLKQMEQRGAVTKGAHGYTLDLEDGQRHAPASPGELQALSRLWTASRERENATELVSYNSDSD